MRRLQPHVRAGRPGRQLEAWEAVDDVRERHGRSYGPDCRVDFNEAVDPKLDLVLEATR
jgi:hypothetical protein